MSVCPACKLSHTNMQKQPSAGVVTNFSSCFDNWVRSKSNLAPVMFRKLLQNHREAVEQQLLENKKKYLENKFTEEDAKPAKPYSVMYGEQVENVKQMLTTLGFQFDKVDMTQFGIETTQAVGSVEVPYNLYDDDGDMYYVYNCYTTKEDDKMYEFRIVFDSSQLSVVKQSLKAGGFVVF